MEQENQEPQVTDINHVTLQIDDVYQEIKFTFTEEKENG